MTLPLLLVLTLAIVGVSAVAHRWLGRSTGLLTAVLLAALGCAALPWIGPVSHGEAIAADLPWIPSIGISLSLRLDALSLVFLLLVLFIGALVMAYSARYFSTREKTGDYYIWMLLFVFAMTGMVIADDLIVLFVFWEFTTLCSFFLINRAGDAGPAAAQRTLLITMSGGLGLLTAVLLTIVATGTTTLSAALESPVWHEDPAFAAACALLFAFAAFTKSAQFPFHMWLPDAMVAPAPVSAYLHAAAMVKAGIYLMLRVSPALAENPVWQTVLIAGGLTTAIMGAVFALQRHDIKEMMAYSTVSQLGFLTAVIGVGTPEALAAAIVHVIAHALFKSSLFMMVGVVDHQAHHVRDIRALTGLAKPMRLSLIVMTAGAVSMAGIPPLFGFISKESLLTGFLSFGAGSGAAWILTALAAIAAIGTFAYTGRIVLGTFTDYTGAGRRDEPRERIDASTVKEASALFLLPAIIPAAAGIVFGFIPQVHDHLLTAAVAASAGGGAEPHEVHLHLWHGFTAELAVTAVIIAAGIGMLLVRSRIDDALPRTLLPFTGVGIVEGMRTGAIAFGHRVGDVTRTDMHGLHLTLPGVFLLALAITGGVIGIDLGALTPGHSQPVDWVLLGMLAIFLLGSVVTRNRTAAVVLAGGAGFVVASWFFMLGAVDVGMTQLLVEMLTVVVLVLVLRKLPRRFQKVSRTRTAITALVSIGFGVLAFLGTFVLTGRTDRSVPTEYFLRQTDDVTGATNVVNAILVEFRALDTFGELTVLGIAGFAILAVLNSAFTTSDNAPIFERLWVRTPIHDAAANTTAMRILFQWAAPFIMLLSLMLLVRGHHESGGGFIAALVAGGFFSLRYLVAESDLAAKLNFDYALVTVAGILVGAATGVAGYINGSFLRPVVFDIPMPFGEPYHFTTALVFDIGIYLAVVGTVLIALDRLGQEQRYKSEMLTPRYQTSGDEPDPVGPISLDPGDMPASVDAGLEDIRRAAEEEDAR